LKKKVNFNREIDELINKMTGEKILRYTCQLLVNDKSGLKAHGSGVFIKVNELHILLTAAHVTEGWTDENPLFIRIGATKHVTLVGGFRETKLQKDDKIDLAYIIVDERILPDLKKAYLFLPVSKIRDHKQLLGATNYCVMGYPEKSKQEINGKIEPVAQAYYVSPSSDKVYEYYDFNPDLFYMLEIKGKGTNIKTGEKKKTGTHFYGISGCGLWIMIIDSDGEKINSVDYRLIGIMTEFRNSKYLTLIGIKIRVVLNAIMEFEKIKLNEVKTTYNNL